MGRKFRRAKLAFVGYTWYMLDVVLVFEFVYFSVYFDPSKDGKM